MNLFDRLILPENFYFAWQKAKRLYRTSDGYIDRGEISEFELNLEARLGALRQKFESGSYRTRKLRPLPRPKKLKSGNAIDRQYFHVAVDDQVAWIAIVNALGPELDLTMPSWSYGNRLYRPAWYEDSEEKSSKLEIGPFRHASGHLYRKFQHSWPLFRRHVSLTARAMASGNGLRLNEMDEADQMAMSAAETEKLRYLTDGYWQTATKQRQNDLYYASIDLKQFYPKLDLGPILEGLNEANSDGDERITSIFRGALNFGVDCTGVPDQLIANTEPPFYKTKVSGLPTGLFVAGFLANIAMKKIDQFVDEELDRNKSIAHFRFVDDHTILSRDFDQLCEWIRWYEKLLATQQVGPEINSEKYDPPSLSQWMTASSRNPPSSARSIKDRENKRLDAIDDTKVDGSNPTKLMTKTLAQVSAIAAGDIHILDDEDLQERLKMLEWLLLADIPEREIRPDTRAAFAAGQIAQLAPVLIQEADGLVSKARELASLRNKAPDPDRSTTSEQAKYQDSLNGLVAEVKLLEKKNSEAERAFLRRCFQLLFGAFQDYPGKSRLLFRVLQYCRITGYKGLSEIGEWIQSLRNDGNENWASYFAGLSLQLLGQNAVFCAKLLTTPGTLRSDYLTALNHLNDIRSLVIDRFLPKGASEAWFHSMARVEFAISLLVAARTIEPTDELKVLASGLSDLAKKCAAISDESSHEEWKLNTGRSPSVWAHQFEVGLSSKDIPSASWRMFSSSFQMSDKNDASAARWYPEWMSDDAWNHFLTLKVSLPPSDSGWVANTLQNNEQRRSSAASSRQEAFTRAAKSSTPYEDKITLYEWANKVSDLSPFDPRAGEWTALEIMRHLLTPTTEIEGDEAILDRLHPLNVLIPNQWLEVASDPHLGNPLSWSKWQIFLREAESPLIKEPPNSIIDYRFAGDQKSGMDIHDWERRAATVGFLLLGLFRNDFSTPRVWNIRGHENIYKAPRAQWYQSLAISSPSLLLVEGCLSARSAETRTISRAPSLFGFIEGMFANDTDYDPPRLDGVNALLEAIENAQSVLVENQLSVSMNEPRQLIPFRLRDFGAGTKQGGDENDANPAE